MIQWTNIRVPLNVNQMVTINIYGNFLGYFIILHKNWRCMSHVSDNLILDVFNVHITDYIVCVHINRISSYTACLHVGLSYIDTPLLTEGDLNVLHNCCRFTNTQLLIYNTARNMWHFKGIMGNFQKVASRELFWKNCPQ